MSASWSVPDFIHFAHYFLLSLWTGNCDRELPAHPDLVWQALPRYSLNPLPYLVHPFTSEPQRRGLFFNTKGCLLHCARAAEEARRNGVCIIFWCNTREPQDHSWSWSPIAIGSRPGLANLFPQQIPFLQIDVCHGVFRDSQVSQKSSLKRRLPFR